MFVNGQFILFIYIVIKIIISRDVIMYLKLFNFYIHLKYHIDHIYNHIRYFN